MGRGSRRSPATLQFKRPFGVGWGRKLPNGRNSRQKEIAATGGTWIRHWNIQRQKRIMNPTDACVGGGGGATDEGHKAAIIVSKQ